MAAFSINGQRLPTISPIAYLYAFLADFANFKSILPEDKVEDFSHDQESCSFTIKGITAIRIRLVEKVPNRSLRFESEGLAKFNFVLLVHFEGEADSPGMCSVNMSADMNPFIFKMAEKALSQLVNNMGQKLSVLQPQHT